MALNLVTPAAVPPVTLAEVKLACRFDPSDLDTEIESMLLDAARLVSHETGQSLMPETWELTLDAFPDAAQLTRLPVASITSVKYKDPAGVEQTLDSSAYVLDSADGYGFAWLQPAAGVSWPATGSEVNAVRIRYVAGFTNAAAVPSHLKRQVKIFVAMMIEDQTQLSDRMAAISKVYHV